MVVRACRLLVTVGRPVNLSVQLYPLGERVFSESSEKE
jgi:hypothetical protein